GVVYFVVNCVVCFLIIFDKDKRGRGYRKYVLSLQISSMLTDVFFTIGSPILLVNNVLIYNVGFNPFRFRTSTFLILFFILFTEIGSSYFSCAYYRRN
ncbi:hypothetical protein PFISCL1PPCAC_11284, partial [Pristionchus fissidentatus]